MTTKLKIPKIRFKEFSCEWEEMKLGEIGDFKNGLNKDKSDFGFGKPFINLMDVFGKPYFKNTNLGLVNTTDKELDLYNLKKGDILFIRSSVKLEGVGETSVILEDLNNTTYSGFLIRFRIKDDLIYDYYKKYCFSIRNIRNQILSYATSSANTNINQESLNIIKINLPSSLEQQKIASFLSSIDEKIENIKEKKKSLEEYKKGVMQKIFSQELRFKDENGEEFGEWEEKKLGDLSKITTGKLDANAMVENGEYRFYTCAKDYFKIDNYAFDTEALLISGNGANVGYIHYYKGKFNAYQRTYVLDNFEDNIIYIKFFLDNFLKKRIMSEVNEGNTPYIVLSTLSDMVIYLPTLKEQEKIADFLSGIDEKIEKVSDELEKMEEFKKGLLQGMFV